MKWRQLVWRILVGYDYEVALALHSVKTRDGPLIAPFTPSASPLYSLTGSLSLIHFGELLCFLARATTAQNVKGLGNENGRDRILCEKRLGQKTEKCPFWREWKQKSLFIFYPILFLFCYSPMFTILVNWVFLRYFCIVQTRSPTLFRWFQGSTRSLLLKDTLTSDYWSRPQQPNNQVSKIECLDNMFTDTRF